MDWTEENKEDLHHISTILRSRLETDTSTVGKVTNDLDIEMNVGLVSSGINKAVFQLHNGFPL
jgi:hypothetical protein